MLKSNSLYQLADTLEGFVNYLSHIAEKKRILNDFYQMLNVKIFYENRKSDNYIHVYTEQESVLEYLYNYWTLKSTSKENIADMKAIIEQIRTQMLPPKAEPLTEQRIIDLFHHVESRFHYGENVLKDSPLKILQFNNTHIDWNCFYIATIRGDELIKDYIMMTCPHKPETRQEFGFIHELGHKLHTALTKRLFTAPSSFAWFGQLFQEQKEALEHQGMDEHFADVFAIAALSNSPYEACIPAAYEVDPYYANRFLEYITLSISTMDESVSPLRTNDW